MPVTEEGSTWLPLERCLSWLKIDAEAPQAQAVEESRQAAAEWVEDQRPDLLGGTVEEPTFEAGPRIVFAGVLATARLYTRQGSPTGLVEYGDFAASVLKSDPDVRQLLGRPRPKVG